MFLIKQYQLKQRNNTLDFFRGIFVFWGAVGHFYYLMWEPTGIPLQPSYPIAVFLFNLPYGISVFFPISGFLITSILLKSVEKKKIKFDHVNVFKFYLFRFARLCPAFLLLCASNIILAEIHFPGFELHAPLTWKILLSYVFSLRANVLFCENFYHLFPWGILWSLAIEEVFYLCYPLLCKTLSYFYAIILALFGIVLYGWWYRFEAASAFVVLRTYFGCFDQIALGCIAAFLVHMGYFSQIRRTLLMAGMCLFVMVASFTLWLTNYVWGPTLMGLSVAMILLGLSREKDPIHRRLLLKKIKQCLMYPMCLLGILSYEFYLFHALFFLLLKPAMTLLIAKIGWSWSISLMVLCVEMILLFLLAGALFFYGTNPLRRKIIKIAQEAYARFKKC